MIKKVLAGTILAGLIGVLVYGAINRTVAKTGSADTSHEVGAGRQSLAETDQSDPSSLNRGAGQRAGGGESRGSQGGWNNGAGKSSSAEPEVGQTEAIDWITLETTVVSVESDLLTLTASDGQTIEIKGRTWRYAQEMGFVPQSGDQITLIGFYDVNGFLETAKMENITTGTTLTVRDESGRPMWAGRGAG